MDIAAASIRLSRQAVRAATGLVAIGAASLWLPLLGLPLAAGAAAYAVVRLSPFHLLARRPRFVTPHHRHRAAVTVGCALIVIAGTFCDALYCIDVATSLEGRLGDRIERAWVAGGLRRGDVFHACFWEACATATVIRLPENPLFGVASLSGFTLRSERAFGWRSARAGRRSP